MTSFLRYTTAGEGARHPSRLLLCCLGLVFCSLIAWPVAPRLVRAGSAGPASAIAEVTIYGNFETAGILLKAQNMDFDEAAKVEYRKTGASSYATGHAFVRYDGNHMATSLFGLAPSTSYDVRITLTDPDGTTGTNPFTKSFRTRAEYRLPAAVRIVNVSNQAQLDAAVKKATPGDEIRLAAGTYAKGIHIQGRSGNSSHPIVFTSQSATRPAIQGNADAGIELERANYYVLNNIEVHDEAGDGITIRGCHDIVIRQCYIHDSRPGDYTANILIQHSEEASPPYSGNHLIIDNRIGDDVHDAVDENQGPGPTNENVPGQSYFGIVAAYQPGTFLTIRGNTIYGVVDGVHPCGDEGAEPIIDPNDLDLLDTWRDQNLDVYDNIIYDCKDDGIELDGHMVNGRIFRNRIGKCENAISAAPFYAGPLFVLRNFVHGFHQGCVKQNTGVEGIMRNVLFYHNTVMEKVRDYGDEAAAGYCLYRGEPGQQQNFTYVNNIFYARGRVYNGDMYTGGSYHHDDTFDYDLMYSTRQADSTYAYKWVSDTTDALNNARYKDLASFRGAVHQESHGRWGNPKLNTTPLSGYPANSKLLDLRIKSGSPAIDKGVRIPGINDDYRGSAPDIGAYETGTSR